MKNYTPILSALAIPLLLGLAGLGVSTGANHLASPPYPYGSDKPTAEPTLFAEGIISTGDMELNAAFTPDGKTLYFTKRTPRPLLWDIIVSHFRGGK